MQRDHVAHPFKAHNACEKKFSKDENSPKEKKFQAFTSFFSAKLRDRSETVRIRKHPAAKNLQLYGPTLPPSANGC
jgi:hypothetical protein